MHCLLHVTIWYKNNTTTTPLLPLQCVYFNTACEGTLWLLETLLESGCGCQVILLAFRFTLPCTTNIWNQSKFQRKPHSQISGKVNLNQKYMILFGCCLWLQHEQVLPWYYLPIFLWWVSPIHNGYRKTFTIIKLLLGYKNVISESKIVYVLFFQALEELGILPQCKRFAGTSGGAIIASLLAINLNASKVKKLMHLKMRSLLIGNYIACLLN